MHQGGDREVTDEEVQCQEAIELNKERYSDQMTQLKKAKAEIDR